LIIHPSTAPVSAREQLEGVADLREVPAADGGGVAADELLAALDLRGIDVAVIEGGPTLNSSIVAADLLDEMCLTIDPMIVGGAAPRIVEDAGPTVARAWRTAHLLEHDGVLFWRLVRDRDASPSGPS
jgi:5-amino-6-(5-phosphoribosylamino)uracil reductase